MSWLFSQALVEEYSVDTSLAGEQYAQLNVMPTPHKFWRNDKTMEFSDLSRFGLTCAVLTESHGEELLMSCLEDFHARTYQSLVAEPVLMETDPDFGDKWQESSVRYDLVSCSWKTHHCLWEEVLPWSLVTLPKWGLMRSGVVYQHQALERPINGTASGLWPTPRATDYKGSRSPLSGAKVRARGFSLNLQEAIAEAEGGGTLNPEWDEWLMGWPIGWTELKPLETGRFREWLRQHSPQFQGTGGEA